jgi:hypothetical protein
MLSRALSYTIAFSLKTYGANEGTLSLGLMAGREA